MLFTKFGFQGKRVADLLQFVCTDIPGDEQVTECVSSAIAFVAACAKKDDLQLSDMRVTRGGGDPTMMATLVPAHAVMQQMMIFHNLMVIKDQALLWVRCFSCDRAMEDDLYEWFKGFNSRANAANALQQLMVRWHGCKDELSATAYKQFLQALWITPRADKSPSNAEIAVGIDRYKDCSLSPDERYRFSVFDIVAHIAHKITKASFDPCVEYGNALAVQSSQLPGITMQADTSIAHVLNLLCSMANDPEKTSEMRATITAYSFLQKSYSVPNFTDAFWKIQTAEQANRRMGSDSFGSGLGSPDSTKALKCKFSDLLVRRSSQASPLLKGPNGLLAAIAGSA